MENNNRLQFIHCEHIFSTAEEAKNWVVTQQQYNIPSLVGEPIILEYADNITTSSANPNVILAIGSVGQGKQSTKNKTFFIDSATLDKDIQSVSGSVSGILGSITEIKQLINQIRQNSIINLISSNTIDFIKTIDEGSGKTYTANIKLDNETGDNSNILKTTSEGLYATVELSYNDLTNVITFNNGNKSTSIQLQNVQILKSATYDHSTDEIVLVFETKEGIQNTVRIPVKDLINEWGIENTNHTITLVLNNNTGGTLPDKYLSADVNLASDADHNILKKVNNGNGYALYVNGSADNIYYNGTYLTVYNKVETLSTDLDKTSNKLDDLIIAVDNDIAVLSGDVNTNKNGIANLNTSLNTTNAKLIDETNRAIAAETKNTTDIATEKNRAIAAENDVLGKLTNEINRATTRENNISDLVATNTAKINGLTTGLTSETASRIAETNRAVAAETSIANDLAAEKLRLTNTETRLDKKIDDETTNRVSAIQQEVLDRNTAIKSASDALTININTESQLRKDNDNLLSAATSSNATNIITEIDRARLAEGQLETNLNNEITNRTIADNGLQAQITANKISVDDTTTLDLTITTAETGSKIIGKVLINGAIDNIISDTDAGGIYAKSSLLSYDKGTNILTFTDSKGNVNTFELVGAKLLGTGSRYDADTNSLILVFTDGTSISIPLAGLIEEWTVKDSDTIALTREYNATALKDILTASAKLSTNPKNVLTTSGNGLFVSNEASSYKVNVPINVSPDGIITVQAAYDRLESEIGSANTEINKLKDGVNKSISGITVTDSKSINLDSSVENGIIKLSSNAIINPDLTNVLQSTDGGLFVSNDASKYKYSPENITLENKLSALTIANSAKGWKDYTGNGIITHYEKDGVDDKQMIQANIFLSTEPTNLIDIKDDKSLYVGSDFGTWD